MRIRVSPTPGRTRVAPRWHFAVERVAPDPVSAGPAAEGAGVARRRGAPGPTGDDRHGVSSGLVQLELAMAILMRAVGRRLIVLACAFPFVSAAHVWQCTSVPAVALILDCPACLQALSILRGAIHSEIVGVQDLLLSVRH